MINITNPLEWNLVTRRTLTASPSKRISPASVVVSANQVVVGILVNGQPTWRFGGFLTQYISALPSSTADFFTAATQVQRFRLTCRNYQAIELAEALPKPYICTIDFPPWFQDCELEIFERNSL
jgi:hypothetical protein